MSSHRLLLGGALALSALAPALPAQTSLGSSTSYLGMDDVEITPDQRYAVVRHNHSDHYALVFDLATGQEIPQPFTPSFPCGDCLDAVAVTNSRAIVLGGVTCTILDLSVNPPITIARPPVGQWANDVAITPDGTIAAVRGGHSKRCWDHRGTVSVRSRDGAQIGYWPGEPPEYDYDGTVDYSYDTDSVVVSNNHAVMLSIIGPQTLSPRTRVTIWDLHPAAPWSRLRRVRDRRHVHELQRSARRAARRRDQSGWSARGRALGVRDRDVRVERADVGTVVGEAARTRARRTSTTKRSTRSRCRTIAWSRSAASRPARKSTSSTSRATSTTTGSRAARTIWR
jgi:hypothetical protein